MVSWAVLSVRRKKDILHAVNRCTNVTADAGTAGGITAENHSGQTIGNCKNYGNVSSSDGYAAGIAATNEGTIRDCVVSGGSGTGGIKIHSSVKKKSEPSVRSTAARSVEVIRKEM